jgi:hypothetical protein
MHTNGILYLIQTSDFGIEYNARHDLAIYTTAFYSTV